MTRYRRKPVEVEAMQVSSGNVHEVAEWMGGKGELAKLPGPGRGMHDGIRIRTLEGTMTADLGDYVIRGVQGEFYPCRSDIFEATYERVSDD